MAAPAESLGVLAKSEDASSSDEESSSFSQSTSSPSTTTASGTGHTHHSESTKLSLTHHETKAVNRTKMLVYLMLFLAATGVGITVYFLSHRSEVEEFEVAVRPSCE